VVIAAAIGALFFWRRRRQRYSTVGSTTASPRGGEGKDGTYYGGLAGKGPVSLPGSELQGNDERIYQPYNPALDEHGYSLSELPPSTTPVELAADHERR